MIWLTISSPKLSKTLLVPFLSMDTLSGSASTFNIPRLHPTTSNQLHHFKNHLLPHHSQLISSTTIKPKTYPKASNKTTTTSFTTHNNFIPPFVNSSQASALQSKQPSKPSQFIHQKPSTGYAVALLDAARCHNVLETVERDVKRLSKWLRNDQLRDVITNPCLEKKQKGDILKELVIKGKFHKHLVKLVNLLVEKTEVEMLSQVLMEFERVYDELSGSAKTSQLVLVSPGVKMEENQVLGIAKRV